MQISPTCFSRCARVRSLEIAHPVCPCPDQHFAGQMVRGRRMASGPSPLRPVFLEAFNQGLRPPPGARLASLLVRGMRFRHAKGL